MREDSGYLSVLGAPREAVPGRVWKYEHDKRSYQVLSTRSVNRYLLKRCDKICERSHLALDQ